MMHKNTLLLLTLLVLVLIRIPLLLSWNKFMTGNDAAIYMEKGMHLAEGKGFTSSICRFIPGTEETQAYIDRFGNQTQEIKVAPLSIFLISGLYGLFGEAGYMPAINLLNLMLFLSLLLLLYFRVIPIYIKDTFTRLIALWFVGFNVIFLEGGFGAHLEVLTIFLFICVYAFHVKLMKNDKDKCWESALFAVLLSLLFLSKYSSIPFIAAFLAHLLWKRKISSFLWGSLGVLAIAGSWFVLRDIILQGKVIASFSLTPFAVKPPAILTLEYWKLVIYHSYQVAAKLIIALMDPNGLGLLLPFAIIYFASDKKDDAKHINWFLLGFALLFFFVYGYIDLRYIYPALIPLIVAACGVFSDLMKRYQPKARISAMSAVLIIILSYQLFVYVDFLKAVRKQARDRESIFQAADQLVSKQGIRQDDMVLTNILGYNVYSEIGIVQTPSDLNSTNRQTLLELYDIDYVLYCSDQLDTSLAWDQWAVHTNIFEDLPLLAVSAGDDRVKLYAIPAGQISKENK